MKIIKGLATFIFAIFFGSCFNPPEFPVVPKIEFNRVEFIENSSTAFDSLVIYIDFRDGDGDLGIDPENPKYIAYPFNDANFFQENNGRLDTLHTTPATAGTEQYEVLDVQDPAKGKMVTFRTRKDPAYSSILPGTYTCSNYEILADRSAPNKPSTGRKLVIHQDDLAAIDHTKSKIVDTLTERIPGSPGNPPRDIFYYQIVDTVYFELNPNHYNIEVDFLVKEPGNPNADAQGFVEFDWFAPPLCQTFDGRFPVLTNNQNSLEGTLSYSMISTGFVVLFSIKTLKLRIQIKDIALHKSNVIETPEFTLDKIRK
jgi:hypothetical protein